MNIYSNWMWALLILISGAAFGEHGNLSTWGTSPFNFGNQNIQNQSGMGRGSSLQALAGILGGSNGAAPPNNELGRSLVQQTAQMGSQFGQLANSSARSSLQRIQQVANNPLITNPELFKLGQESFDNAEAFRRQQNGRPTTTQADFASVELDLARKQEGQLRTQLFESQARLNTSLQNSANPVSTIPLTPNTNTSKQNKEEKPNIASQVSQLPSREAQDHGSNIMAQLLSTIKR